VAASLPQTTDILRVCRNVSNVPPRAEVNSHWRLASDRARSSIDLDYAQDGVRSIGVSVGEEPCCIWPIILKP